MAGERDAGGKPEVRLSTRLIWFVALWCAGVTAVGIVALVIRQLL